jgi:hypothetical protein
MSAYENANPENCSFVDERACHPFPTDRFLYMDNQRATGNIITLLLNEIKHLQHCITLLQGTMAAIQPLMNNSDFLQSLHCSYGQGYWYSQPLSPGQGEYFLWEYTTTHHPTSKDSPAQS